jgi:hypothetical protein
MNERKAILNYRRMPRRMSGGEVAEYLNLPEHAIQILCRAKLLKPLAAGEMAPNSIKWFCTAEIEELGNDRSFLDRATKVIAKTIREQNQAQAQSRAAAETRNVRRPELLSVN